MRAHVESERVQRWGCWALREMAQREGSRETLGLEGSCAAITNGMRAHPFSLKVESDNNPSNNPNSNPNNNPNHPISNPTNQPINQSINHHNNPDNNPDDNPDNNPDNNPYNHHFRYP